MSNFLTTANARSYFDAQSNSLAYDPIEMTRLIQEYYMEVDDPILTTFNVFDFLRVNDDGKYHIKTELHSILGARPCAPCSWNPYVGASTRNYLLEPKCVEFDAEWCVEDEEVKHFKSIANQKNALASGVPTTKGVIVNANGTKTTVNFQETEARLIAGFADSKLKGYRALQSAGGVYNVPAASQPAFQAGVSALDQTWFANAQNSLTGYVKTLSLGYDSDPTGLAHFNVQNVFIDIVGPTKNIEKAEYTGSFVDAYDKLTAKMTPLQKSLWHRNITTVMNGNLQRIILVSASIFDAIRRDFNTTRGLPIQNDRIITRERVAGQDVYFYDNIPVVVDTNINVYDTYKKGYTHFMALTYSRVIGLGSSFRLSNDTRIGAIFQLQTQLDKLGKLQAKTTALGLSTITSPDLIVSSQLLTKWT